MKAFKGFNEDMTCRGYQYEEGKTYETERAELCQAGFHACEYPLDCFGYYSPEKSVYHEVELDDVSKAVGPDDSKRVGKRIGIGARLSLTRIAELSVKYIHEHLMPGREVANIIFHSAATNTGDFSAATNTGDFGAATNIGTHSAATNTGDFGAATNTGDHSAATNTGDFGAAINTGDFSAATNTGDFSAATNTGIHSAAINTGNHSAATNTGRGGVAIAIGYQSRARGAIDSAICVCERGKWNGKEYPLLAIKAAIIDGEILKPDTWYALVNGEFQEWIGTD